MASENETGNETFDEVLRCIRNDIAHFIGNPVKHTRDLLKEYHDRFLAAHRREISVLRDAIKDAIELSCATCPDYEEDSGKCKDKDGVCPPVARWRKALEGDKDGNA